MIEKTKTNGISVEIKIWDFETIETEAIVTPTDRCFSGSGGFDSLIHKRAGRDLSLACKEFGIIADGDVRITEGFQLPVKKIVHAAVPMYRPENMAVMEQCYYQCIQSVAFGTNICRSLMIPLLGVGSKGWNPKDSMRCAWRAILRYSEDTVPGSDKKNRLKRIVFACNREKYLEIRELRKNPGFLFLRRPQQWHCHGDLILWNYLGRRLSEYVVSSDVLSSIGLLKIVTRIFKELTEHPLEKGRTYFVKQQKEYGELAGMPVSCDFWLNTGLPLLMENLCIRMEELGLPQMDTLEVLIDKRRWTLPKECEHYLKAIYGTDLFVLETVKADEKKISLKKTGLKYSPLVESALKICFEAHKMQTDHSGLPYVIHPFHLAEQMETEDEICTALLHDVVEDSDYTIADLEDAGFSEEVIDAVSLLTHDREIPYMKYVCAIRKNKIARKVKLADLTHNSDPKRKALVTEWDRKRAAKYRIAKAILEDDRFDSYTGYYRKRIPLDDIRRYFLSVFYEPDGIEIKYSLDVEDAADTHVEFPQGHQRMLTEAMGKQVSFPEALSEYLADHSKEDFIRLLVGCGVNYQVFHYGD